MAGMAGLVSPSPAYLQHGSQYTPYPRPHSAYSETPPLSAAPLAHPVPHQPVGQFMTAANLGPHEDGKIYSLVIDLLDPNSREGALLELSKKREQYDDLALVLWHSFGECYSSLLSHRLLIEPRNYACSAPGDCLCVSTARPTQPYRACVKSCL